MSDPPSVTAPLLPHHPLAKLDLDKLLEEPIAAEQVNIQRQINDLKVWIVRIAPTLRGHHGHLHFRNNVSRKELLQEE